MLWFLIIKFSCSFLATLKWKARKINFLVEVLTTGWKNLHFLFYFFVDFVLVLFVNWFAWTVLVVAFLSRFGQFIKGLKPDKSFAFGIYKVLMHFLFVAHGSRMTDWPLIASATTVGFSSQSFFLFSHRFYIFFSFRRWMVYVGVHFKCRIPLGPFFIISFVKPLIGKIIAIMHSGNDTVKLELIFHKDVVLAFPIKITSINERERL